MKNTELAHRNDATTFLFFFNIFFYLAANKLIEENETIIFDSVPTINNVKLLQRNPY